MNQNTIRNGLTLVELLTVIAIIGILASLTLAGVSAARESARRVSCGNHLEQIGIAWQSHLTTWRHYPSNGWGWTWVGDSSRGVAQLQPGGWCHNLLPYLDEKPLYGDTAEQSSRTRACEMPVPVFNCPARRPARSYLSPDLPISPRNIGPISRAFRTDYAACAGDFIVGTPPGPRTADLNEVENYAWPDISKLTGVTHVRSEISDRDILDGSSNQLLAGEKYVGTPFYFNGMSDGDDQGILFGDDADNRRFTNEPPRVDSPIDDIQHFGSAHSSGCNFVFADGRMQNLSYAIDPKTFSSLGNRRDSSYAKLE
jgi:prepilin-type N-terminal cleavage/methylation domain-containing protein/prepilin-type processing-associated H-X9-DG protein